MIMIMMMINDELFLRNAWATKGVSPYFQSGILSEILTIANLRHTAGKIWTCAETEFKIRWKKLCSSDNRYTRHHYHLQNILIKIMEEIFNSESLRLYWNLIKSQQNIIFSFFIYFLFGYQVSKW